MPAATVVANVQPTAMRTTVTHCEAPRACHMSSWPSVTTGSIWSNVYNSGFQTGWSCSLIGVSGWKANHVVPPVANRSIQASARSGR